MLVLSALLALVVFALTTNKPIKKLYRLRDRKGRFTNKSKKHAQFYSVTDMRKEIYGSRA